jgi:hypothetical protein
MGDEQTMVAITHFQTSWRSMLGLLAMGLITTLGSGCQIMSSPKVSSGVDLAEGTPLTIIGEAEYVTILPLGLKQKARIDTGATTCSIHASSIKRFERDGEKWVRFELGPEQDADERFEVERPIVRIASIKRHGAKDQTRPVVRLAFQLGPIADTIEFSLTDRSAFEFPILVGRNLLSGHALVDVNKRYTTGK